MTNTNNYLMVKVMYTDGHGAGKEAMARRPTW